MLKRLFFLCLVSLLSKVLVAQTCTISAPSYICLGDLMAFNYTSSANVLSAYWEFGDNNTSILNNPFHQYGSAGKFTIKLTLSIVGGGSCITTKEIDVFPLPIVNFSVNNTNLCLPRATICLTDNSTASDATRPLVKKLILWGDGAADSFNYLGGKKHCYTYKNAGITLPLLIDIRDNRGCRNQDTVNVNVFDGITSFDFHNDVSFRCDSNYLYFCNRSTFDTSIGMKFKWIINGDEFEDKKTNYSVSAGRCISSLLHVQKQAGAVIAKLAYENKFGCKDTLTKISNYLTYNFTPTLSHNIDTNCLNSEFVFTANDNANRKHHWKISNGIDKEEQAFGSVFKFTPPSPGKWSLVYEAKENDCVKILFDSIFVRGPSPDIEIRNEEQCNVNDTVYFEDISTKYLNDSLVRLWSFNDPNAPQCTTNTDVGLNVGLNCNFSRDKCAKHFYSMPDCYEVKLVVEDTFYGCKDSAKSEIMHNSIAPYNDELLTDRHPNAVYCEYETVRLLKAGGNCESEIIAIHKDSANPSLTWESFSSQFNYATHFPVSADGWVTFGIVRKLGDKNRFSGNKGQILTVDDNAICLDTIWLHKFLRVIKQPTVEPIIVSIEECKPFKAVIKLSETPNIDVYNYQINWGDGSKTKDTLENEQFPDSFVHFYQDGLKTNIRFFIASETGCAGLGFVAIQNSFNSSFDFYKGKHKFPLIPKSSRIKKICIGDTVTFEDSVFYAGSFTSTWRENGVIEKLEWDFGDGSPTVIGTFPLHHVYKKGGLFIAKMIATDTFGCTDTIKQQVLVPEVLANIENTEGKIICGDITRLFDSSQLSYNYTDDYIAKWFWDFGDGKAPSYLEDPFRNYPKSGLYTVLHIAENTYGCKDTISIQLRVKGPEPYFDIISDTVACPDHLVQFDNKSLNASNYIWNFGNTANNILSTTKDTNVSYRYLNPGIYDIYLTAADSIYNPFTGDYSYCAVTFPDTLNSNAPIRRIRVVPKRKVDFSLPDTVCANIPFTLADSSDPIYSRYNWYIDNNTDSVKTTNKPGQYAFTSEGNYKIVYKPRYTPPTTTEPECLDSASKTIEVIGFDVGFKYEYEKECGHYTFYDTSDQTIINYSWDFGQPAAGIKNTSFEKNTEHYYGGDTGQFLVCLAAESRFGCKDTVCKLVSNDYLAFVQLYNVFTPNQDGYNDDYDILIENELLYKIEIYNRYGTTVFKGSNDGSPNDGKNWNGTFGNVGSKCAEGTYYYTFTYRLSCTESKDEKTVYGVISLIR